MGKEQFAAVRAAMAARQMDFYYIPSTDYHDSEYVEDYFRFRDHVSGFTGSSGDLLMGLEEDSALWTDGRYFIQAEKELTDGIQLMRMGEEGVPTLEEYLERNLCPGMTLGFDGRVVNAARGKRFEALAKKKGSSLRVDVDLAGELWTEGRPPFPKPVIWAAGPVGESLSERVERVREAMRKSGATVHILSSLDDVAWLFHIRKGGQCLLPLSHALITLDSVRLFLDMDSLEETVRDELRENQVELCPYDDIYDAVKAIKGETILLEPGKVNYALYQSIDESCRIVEAMNPSSPMKAVKTEVEMENMRNCHVRDGAAVTKFLLWLKERAEAGITETEAAERLEEFRRQQEGYLGPSFDTISAYGPNAAMCHYHAKKGSDAVIAPEGLYLVDSGGQYVDGTTDVTRTIAMGPVTEEMKRHCTLVAMGMLRLSAAKFPYGCHGENLDAIARGPLWAHGLDFNHGTGHGVGYISNVHERPNAIRWRWPKNPTETCVLEEGMITSNEPGLYIEGKYGIRTENLLLCKAAEKNAFGQFMEFETLTYVPIDMDTIDVSIMEPSDLGLLYAYQKKVYEKISPLLDADEAQALWNMIEKIAGSTEIQERG